jgi:hypothetical protein
MGTPSAGPGDSNGGSGADDGTQGSPAPGDVVTDDAGTSEAGPQKPPPPIAYAGALATTAKVPFGGPPYCKYNVTLKNVTVDVQLLATGEIADATVTDLMVEEAVSCPHPPANPNNQSFAFDSAQKTADGVKVTFKGASTNSPKTSLVMTVTTSPADGGVDGGSDGYPADLTWTRTDEPAPLAWKVNAKVSLYPK